MACVGDNDRGQLGIQSRTLIKQPTTAAALDGMYVTSVAVGLRSTCVLTSEGTMVYCLGTDLDGTLSDNYVRGLRQSSPIAQVAAKDYYTCVLYAASGAAGSVQCWGGLLGVQTEQGFRHQVVPVVGVDGAISIGVASETACVVLSNRTAACWTFQSQGPLVAKAVPDLVNVVGVAVGFSFRCAIVRPALEPGSLWCWGGNRYTVYSGWPMLVSGLPGNVTDVALGRDHACALVDSSADSSGGDVYCWGANGFGQLGQGYYNVTRGGNPIGIFTPTRIEGLSRVRALYPGADNTCAVTAAQQVMCWGNNQWGVLTVDPAKQVIANISQRLQVPVVPSPAALLDVCV
jgi:alpha-tubulin suppressor-like RCC1 family protein